MRDLLYRLLIAGAQAPSARPDASPYDWASILVVGLLFLLPIALSLVLDRLWTARERTQLEAAQKEGPAFRIPPMLRQPTLFAVLALAAISLFVFLCALNGARTGITTEAGLGIPLIFSPLVIGGLVFLLHHTGLVVLTAQGVALRRPGRERFLPYTDITEVRSQARIFAPGLLIQGGGRTLRIPRTIDNLPHLYELLLERVPTTVRATAMGRTATAPGRVPEARPSAATAAGPVVTLAVSRRVWALYAAGTVLLVLIHLGIGLLGLWMGLAQGRVPPFTGRWMGSAGIFFLLVSLLFVPAIVFVLYSLFTRYGPDRIERPVAWQLYPDRIRYRFPRSLWHERPAGDLVSATLKPKSLRVQASADGARVQQRVTVYMLILDFAGGQRLCIDQERAFQFRETPERLHAIIRSTYLTRSDR